MSKGLLLINTNEAKLETQNKRTGINWTLLCPLSPSILLLILLPLTLTLLLFSVLLPFPILTGMEESWAWAGGPWLALFFLDGELEAWSPAEIRRKSVLHTIWPLGGA